MISIITCFINPERLERLERNIARTIGDIPYEVIAVDNRVACRSIASVYNMGAMRAKYPCLLFIHEDAGFVDTNWFPEIWKKLSEPDCGVIGFAGSQLMLNCPGGWMLKPEWCVWNLLERETHIRNNVGAGAPSFREVAVVDGFAMFVRKDIWQKYPFDETAIKGFHCYDIDFSLSVGTECKNYVCTDILLYHDSKGRFDDVWAKQTQKLYKEKWSGMLPRIVPGLNLSSKEKSIMEERALWRFLKLLERYGIEDRELYERFRKYPYTFQHIRHTLRILLKK